MKRSAPLLYILLLAFVCLLAIPSHSQDPDDFDEPVDVPVDGGLSVLLAAGGIYVVRKMYRKKR